VTSFQPEPSGSRFLKNDQAFLRPGRGDFLSLLVENLFGSLSENPHVTISFFQGIVDLPVHKWVVLTILGPRAGFWNPGEFNEAPVDGGLVAYAEIVSNSGRDIDSRALVALVFGALVSKDILPVIGHERPAVLPLSVTNLAGFRAVDLHPTAFAG
jgi:hypothetical protein